MVASRIGGVSIQGTYHDKNQDSFLAQEINDIHVLVVSDGLGSLEYSGIGSLAVCEAMIKTIRKIDVVSYGAEKLITALYNNWCELLKLPINSCSATCLCCIISSDRVTAFRLGDGFVCLLGEEDNNVLFDSKEDSFDNETDCLSDSFEIGKWEIQEFDRRRVKAVVMCSDGVKLRENSPEIVTAFACDIYNEYADKSQATTQTEIKQWLTDWTGDDDKTLVYFWEEKYVD
jgi:serine/threonine protein phosphatase PrpC